MTESRSTAPASGYLAGGRLRFLDALRGIAALLVAWFHFYWMTPLREPMHAVLPEPLHLLMRYGGLGVQIFFVLSGFVIAFSVREARIDGRFLGRFALRRSIRLDPPYWLTILLAVAIAAASHLVLARPVPVPSWQSVLAHVTYTQNILGFQNIVSVFWTLAYEVQFYLVLVVLLGLLQRGARARSSLVRRLAAPVLFVPLGLVSLAMLAAGYWAHGWFVDWWYAFFLGAVTYWTLAGRVRTHWWALLFVATTLAAFAPAADPGAWVVVATAAVIFAVGRAGRLATLLDVRPLQFLGRISYSLYLVHFLGATAAKLGARVTGESVPAAFGWFLLANAVSIGAAYAMYRLVEAPSLRLTKQPDPVAALRGLLRGRRPPDVTVAKPASGFAE